MKVSKEKRDEIRRALLNAAVSLFVEKGLAETTMREIAARANVAPGTAYKYFPDRERLLHAFFEVKLQDAEAKLAEIEDLASYSLKEKLHALLDSLLDEFLPDREFVAIAIRSLVDAPLQSLGALQPIRRRLVALVEGFFEDAAERGELELPAQSGFLTNLFWDYSILVVLYWVNDDSENFGKTAELLDKSLEIYVTFVRSGIVDQAARLGMFLLKNHLYSNIEHLGSVFGAIGELRLNRFGGR